MGRRKASGAGQVALPAVGARDEHLDIGALETWLWDAACAVRGATDAPKFKDFILPLIFFKRLSDVLDDELARQIEEFGDEEIAREVIEADHAGRVCGWGRPSIAGFSIPVRSTGTRCGITPVDGSLGEFVTTAMREVAKLNPDLQGVLDVRDYNERQSGERTLGDERLAALIEVVSRHRLGFEKRSPTSWGGRMNTCCRKFAEGQGQSAGEFYTPYAGRGADGPADRSAAGERGLRSGVRVGGIVRSRRGSSSSRSMCRDGRVPKLYGQELNPTTFAMAKMNMFLHGYADAKFAIGDTFTRPGFNPEAGGNTGAGAVRRFDYVVANPMWNQDNYPGILL